MRDTFVNKIHELARNDSEIYLVTADLGFGIFDKFATDFPRQFLNVGVAEQLMIGVASGMALEGAKVVVYSIGNFATLRCLEQIRNDAAYHNLNVTIVASGGGFTYGQLGMSHHATEDLAIMRSIPGVDVFAPATKEETSKVIEMCLSTPHVSYLRLEKNAVTASPLNGSSIQLGKLTKYRDGKDVTIISVGGITNEAIIVSDRLKEKNINVSVLGCHSLKPVDVDGILKSAVESNILITLEEHSKIGGLSSIISDICLNYGVMPKKFYAFGLEDNFSSIVGDQNFLRAYYKIDALSIESYILNNI